MKISYLIPALFTPGIFTPSRRGWDRKIVIIVMRALQRFDSQTGCKTNERRTIYGQLHPYLYAAPSSLYNFPVSLSSGYNS
jgi:hypothetical protein